MYILREVEKFLREKNMPVSKFGRESIGDPRLVADLRVGRNLRPATEKRIRKFMESYDG